MLSSVAAPLIGGLLGRKKQEPIRSEIDYVKMRANAEAAGFNPLTALRAGGGAGFTVTHHPALASGSFIADAISGLGNVVSSIDPMRDATAKLEYELKQATLANIQADTQARLRSSLGGVPVSTGARNVKQSSPLAKPLPASAGAARTPTVETPTLTNPIPATWGGIINPAYVDAEAWETRYGDIAQEIGGGINAVADLYQNFERKMDGYFFPKGRPAVKQTKPVREIPKNYPYRKMVQDAWRRLW